MCRLGEGITTKVVHRHADIICTHIDICYYKIWNFNPTSFILARDINLQSDGHLNVTIEVS